MTTTKANQRGATPQLLTKEAIETRLRAAGRTLLALRLIGDEARHLRRAERSAMPETVRSIGESYGHDPARLPRTPPSAAEIDAMDQALGWLAHAPDADSYAVLLARAMGVSFPRIAARDAKGRSLRTIQRLYRAGLEALWRAVNGGAPGLWQIRRDAVASLQAAMLFGTRDWAAAESDAWMFGIIVGWGDELSAVARRHGWSPEAVARLERLAAGLRPAEPAAASAAA